MGVRKEYLKSACRLSSVVNTLAVIPTLIIPTKHIAQERLGSQYSTGGYFCRGFRPKRSIVWQKVETLIDLRR